MIPLTGQTSGAVFTARLVSYTQLDAVIEATDNLISPKWQRIWTNTITATAPLEFIDPNAAAHSQRFYRVTSR
jgi:hypothetical protein